MSLQIEEHVYPRESDLEALIDEGCFNSVKDLMRDEGIFIIAKKNYYHQLLKRYMFGQDFFDSIYNQLSRKYHGISLSGLRFPSKAGLDIHATFSMARTNQEILVDGKYRPKILQVSPKDKDGSFNATIEYEKINSKFTAFKRKEIHKLDIKVLALDEKTVEVCGNPSSSPESMIIRDVAINIFKKHDIQYQPFGLQSLAIKQRVDLFDTIISNRSKKEWQIEEVCGLGIKTDFDEESVLDTEETNVLSKAVLEGKGLREHKIVEDLIKENYYFNSTSIWVTQSPNLMIKVRIEFKENPKVLVVKAESAKSYRNTEDDHDEWVTRAVPNEEGRKCIRYFWNFVHEVYQDSIRKTQAQSKSVIRK